MFIAVLHDDALICVYAYSVEILRYVLHTSDFQCTLAYIFLPYQILYALHSSLTRKLSSG